MIFESIGGIRIGTSRNAVPYLLFDSTWLALNTTVSLATRR